MQKANPSQFNDIMAQHDGCNSLEWIQMGKLARSTIAKFNSENTFVKF